MRNAYIAGVGMIRFGKYRDRSIEDMAGEVVLKALADAGLERQSIEETFCGTLFGGTLAGQRILRYLGMTGMPITNVENACSSGSSALRQGVASISMGRADAVLVIGVEKLSGFEGTIPLEATDIEATQGMVMPGLYAMRARRYMHVDLPAILLPFEADHAHARKRAGKQRNQARFHL